MLAAMTGARDERSPTLRTAESRRRGETREEKIGQSQGAQKIALAPRLRASAAGWCFGVPVRDKASRKRTEAGSAKT